MKVKNLNPFNRMEGNDEQNKNEQTFINRHTDYRIASNSSAIYILIEFLKVFYYIWIVNKLA